jgi:hypothetical protein
MGSFHLIDNGFLNNVYVDIISPIYVFTFHIFHIIYIDIYVYLDIDKNSMSMKTDVAEIRMLVKTELF